MRRFILTATLVASLSACTNSNPTWHPFPSMVYKIEVQQGTYVTQDTADKLQVGMTPSQVRFLLGSASVQDPFHANRWDYLYELAQGAQIKDLKRFTVYFSNDQLVRWEGDILPPHYASVVDETPKPLEKLPDGPLTPAVERPASATLLPAPIAG